MVKASVIITEKKSVSKAIAKALFPELFDERDNCEEEHSDIISLRNPKEAVEAQRNEELCVAAPYKEKEFFYFCSSDCVNGCQFVAYHLDSMGRDHASGTRRKLRYQNESGKQEKLIFEDVSYYVFDRGGGKVVIMDTQGNPFSHFIENLGEKQTLENLILNIKDWESLEKMLKLKPKIEFSENRAYKVRERLFNNVLAKRKFPDGSTIDIDRIIAATDFDVAGSYIFYSVIQKANQFIRQGQSRGIRVQEIPPELLYRMKLQSMDSKDIMDAFNNLMPFDFENARAGEIRALFDFVYGSTLTSSMQKVAYSQQSRFKASIGRTRFLGLKTLIEDSTSIKNEEEKSHIYLVFRGLKDKEGIEEALNQGDYAPLRINQKRARVTPSRLLKSFQERDIGTHTTRCKIPKILVDLGFAQESGSSIFPTKFGAEYYSVLFPHLEKAGFSISDWNQVLHYSMEAIRTAASGKNGKADSDRMKMAFMGSFLNEFKQHLAYLKENWGEIVRAIPPREYPQRKDGQASRGKITTPHNELLLEGTESVLSLEQISEFMDSQANQPKGAAKMYRHIKPTEVYFDDAIRRVCCIDRENDFEVIEGESSKIQDMEEGSYTVFKAEVPNSRRLAKYSKGNSMESYEKLELPEIPKADSAHDLLYLTGVSPACVCGPMGFRLVQEYNLPWILTRDKLEKQRQGLINLRSFSIGRDRFERVERYSFGRAHNFESLLITLFEKYGVSFKDTAELAEQLYLGGA
ncbi:hypothetical protein A3K73_03190 [Candidatus Pacearchaeota archaeon RBG_13_36_9]|nr:MAG: hypothetical protein A3K73_03190 [Candidatus Pacearchaeota archaeon RBG_13_36_9]